MAVRANDVAYTYYNNASHDVIVGTKEYYCDNGTESHGQITAYYTTFQFSCSLGYVPPPPSDAAPGVVYHNCVYDLSPYPTWTCN